ncbi:MAG TPA: glutaminyl-peptide cyclotransferase [Verrucomicrobiae bacterium]|nr:glutaminyl-peptide cyclotransferase [Verrucomicrobiae bacterium]
MRSPGRNLPRTIVLVLAVLVPIFTGGCRRETPPTSTGSDPVFSPMPGTPVYTYRVVNTWPHDRNAFTQGLVYFDGVLLESTGLYGRSSLRLVELNTGRVLQQVTVPPEYFAEGLAALHGKLYQLSWQNQTGFVYDQQTFQLEKEFSYEGEGWGLTTDGQSLILSDGTDRIRFLDPATFAVKRSINVSDEGRPVIRLNELEYVKGEIYANVWQTDFIVRINPTNGVVTGWIDLGGLLSPADRDATTDVLNGIAYDAAGDRLFVTGKFWPKLFEVRLEPKP